MTTTPSTLLLGQPWTLLTPLPLWLMLWHPHPGLPSILSSLPPPLVEMAPSLPTQATPSCVCRFPCSCHQDVPWPWSQHHVASPDEDSGTSLRSGLVRFMGPRLDSQVQSTRVQTSCHDLVRTPDKRKKLRECVCVKLASIISVPNYATLLSPHSSGDMDALALDPQMAH